MDAGLPTFPDDPDNGIVPPAQLDYEVLRLIGRGGYGEVWLVRDQAGRHLACKAIYRVSFDNDRPYEREFEGIKKFEPVSRANESQVNILHVGRRDQAGYFYYVMELADDVLTGQKIIPGSYVPRTLRSELKRRGRLPAGECVRVGLALSAALENLHENGLIHRDIKPANIIFVNGIPKLADIGLVSARDVTVSYVGTEGYIPPEGPGSAPADVYGLGKVLYEMSTGKDRLDYPELPAELGDGAERAALLELNAVVLKACEPIPGGRYGSAGELHADLALLNNGKSVRQRRLVRRRRLTLVRIGLITAGILLLVTGWQAFKPQRTKSTDNTALTALVGSNPPRTAETSAAFADVCIRSGFEALGSDDYQRARELSTAARNAAENSHLPHLVELAKFLAAEVAHCESEYQAVKPFAALKAPSNDPKVNLAAGKFLCFAKNDWEDGLPKLASGTHEGLRAVAERELAGADAIGLGNSWWQLAKNAAGGDKAAFQARARFWYLRAVAAAPDRTALKQQLEPKLKTVPAPAAEIHIHSRVGNLQRIDISASEVTWWSDGLSAGDRINQIILGDLKGKGARTIKNYGATRMFPENVDFSTARLTIDRKAKRRGNAILETSEDHVRLILKDRPAGYSAFEVTITFAERL